MAIPRDPVLLELKVCHKTCSRIVTTMAGIPTVRQDIIEDGEGIIRAVVEAMRNHAAHRSINQSRDDPAGSWWWEGRLGSWMCSVLRISRDADPQLDWVRSVLDRSDLGFLDRIKEIGYGEEMTARPNGPSRIVKLAFSAVPDTIRPADVLDCPVEDCGSGPFSSAKAYNRHLQLKHKDDADRYKFLSTVHICNSKLYRYKLAKSMNRNTNRMGSSWEALVAKQKIVCLLCNDNMEVELSRFNEHYKSVHDKQFVPAGRKVSSLARIVSRLT
jgi:hypothetical protein